MKICDICLVKNKMKVTGLTESALPCVEISGTITDLIDNEHLSTTPKHLRMHLCSKHNTQLDGFFRGEL